MLKNLLEGFENFGDKISEEFNNTVDTISSGVKKIENNVSETTKSVYDGVKKVSEKAVKLKDEVSTNSASVEQSDILNVKEGLKKVGEYKTPEWGMTDFTDNQMFDGIKSFQKKNGLKVDGIMKPDGETVKKLNEKLSNIGNKANKSTDWSKIPNKERFPVYQDKIIKEKYDTETNLFKKTYKKTLDKITKEYANDDTSAGDFARNYRELVAKDTKYFDKKYHAKANFEATKRGVLGHLQAQAISDLRETTDIIKDTFTDGPIKAFKNSVEDHSANSLGRKLGLKYPNDDFWTALEKYKKKIKK